LNSGPKIAAKAYRQAKLLLIYTARSNRAIIEKNQVIFNLLGKMMLTFMFAFFAFFFWQVNRWNDNSLPGAASVHGQKIDVLWDYHYFDQQLSLKLKEKL
jgi:hypothetical protein